MATPNGTVTNVSGDGSVIKVTWTLTTADNTGSPFDCSEYYYKTVQVSGTFGAATAILEGSCDNSTNFFTLTNKAATALGLTVASAGDCDGLVQSIRPRLSVVGVGATVVVTVLLFAPSSRFAQKG